MIQIYGQPTCSGCKRAKKLADDYLLKYEYIDITESAENQERFAEAFPGARSVPQISWNSDKFSTYDDFAEAVMNTISGFGEQSV